MRYYVDIFFEPTGWKGVECDDIVIKENCAFFLDEEKIARVVSPLHAIKYWETRDNEADNLP